MKVISRDKLVQEFRLEKVKPDGKKNNLPKMYLDTKVWIQITDSDLYREIQPAYLNEVANNIDDYWIFMKRTCPKLNMSEDLKKKAIELYNEHMNEIQPIAYRSNLGEDRMKAMTYYELYDWLESKEIIKSKTTKNTK